MLSQRVTVHGSKGDLVGVIGSKPPHILTPEERTKVVAKRDMYIDIGAVDEDMARNLGVFEGCPVTPYAEFAVMGVVKLCLVKPGIIASAVQSWQTLWKISAQSILILYMV